MKTQKELRFYKRYSHNSLQVIYHSRNSQSNVVANPSHPSSKLEGQELDLL
jgi:hypothetical protein